MPWIGSAIWVFSSIIFFKRQKLKCVSVENCKYYIVLSLNRVSFMVFNTTFNNISVISWQSVLLVEEIWENDLSEVSDKLDHRLSEVSDKLDHRLSVPLFKPDKWHSLVLNNKNKLSEKLNADFYILITHYDLLSFNTIDFSVNL